MSCPACGAPFSADDVHAELGIANCRVCRGVLDLRARDRPLALPRPARFVVDESDRRLVISWRWFQPRAIGLLLFCAVWWAVLINWYHRLLVRPPKDITLALFPIGHVAIGVVVLYWSVAMLINRSRIVADDFSLTLRHGPLPWPGKRLERSRLAQLFCETVQSKSSVSFALVGVDVDGKRVRLVGGFDEQDEPRWLEAALEKRLDIRNRPVPGELGPRG